MNIILLSGGSGKRLWPLSNEIRSKQFLRIFKNENGDYESMVERMYRGVKKVDADAKIAFATSVTQISALKNQLGSDLNISVEPCRRDTFPAIALAGAYLSEQLAVSKNEPVVICPVDPYVEDDYFLALKQLSSIAETDEANLYLIGIAPTYPSEKYGYVLPKFTDAARRKRTIDIRAYKEKPDEQTAASYIEQGALWNGGVFACRLRYILEKTKALTGYSGYEELRAHYAELERISFDYAVAEKEERIAALKFDGMWKDLGTWNTLTEAMEEATVGNAYLGENCENTHVINDLDIPVLCMGLKDAVVAASPDGVLVSDKHASSYIKPHVDKLDDIVMYAEKSWGSYQVIDVGDQSLTVKVTLNAGCRMNYHAHMHRDETWTIIAGEGRAIIDDKTRAVKAGDVLRMKAGVKHTLIANERLQAIEVQTGKTITVEDKIKYEFPSGEKG